MVCTTAPVPGETKVWQYITLTRRIYLIDCPGVVPPNPNDTPEEILLRGVVRVENVENPAQYVAAALALCQKRHVERTYDLRGWETADEFLELLARKRGKLHKGGEADMDGVAKTVLNEFLRGKIPWYVPPPKREVNEGEEPKGQTKIVGREGRLGEMAGKRKRDDDEKVEAVLKAATKVVKDSDENDDDEDDDDDEFEGFEGTGVVLPGSIGDLKDFEEDDEVDDDKDDDGDEEEEDVVSASANRGSSEPPPSEEDEKPPGKKRRKG
jgi:nuclear GTP-binding protein